MYKIEHHPILDIPQSEIVEFIYDGQKVQGRKGSRRSASGRFPSPQPQHQWPQP